MYFLTNMIELQIVLAQKALTNAQRAYIDVNLATASPACRYHVEMIHYQFEMLQTRQLL